MMIPTLGHAAAPTPVPPGTEAIVFFEQHFQTGESAGDVQLGAQRISADGKLLWNAGEVSEQHPVLVVP